MKKAGLVTCYIDNYGACLQAYAMQSLLRFYSFDSKIIRYDYKVNINEIKKSFVAVAIFTFKSYINILLKRIKPIEFRVRYNSIIRHNNFANFRLKHLSFTSKISTFEDLINLDNLFDFYICGSDQIWNPTLNFARDIRFDTLSFTNKFKIAFAPSIGVDHIPDKYLTTMRDNISKIDCISCRETVGTLLIKNQLQIQNCDTVLDPTLMIIKEHWIGISKTKPRSKKYIFCYFFNWSKLYEDAICHFSKAMGNIDVISIAFSKKDYQFKGTKNISPKVEDFPSLIANAELVLTDSFHGTAFSINMNTNFYVFSRFNEDDPLSMNSRIDSILSIFNLKDRLITSTKELSNVKITNCIDFKKTNEVLNRERKKASNYLEKSFSYVRENRE